MKFAYADPPYLGLAAKFYGHLHPDAADYDRLETHAALVQRLEREYPDGWAMSLQSGALAPILSVCPASVRVLAWVKPFCSFKPGVGTAYAWEPVILGGGAWSKEIQNPGDSSRLGRCKHRAPQRLSRREAPPIHLVAAGSPQRKTRRSGRRPFPWKRRLLRGNQRVARMDRQRRTTGFGPRIMMAQGKLF